MAATISIIECFGASSRISHIWVLEQKSSEYPYMGMGKFFEILYSLSFLLYNTVKAVIGLNIRLTLQEKLRDLRDEKKLRLSDVAEATGIPTSTMQRLESDEDFRAGYQDIESLARFYGVSTDFLFGLTDNRQHRNVEIDKLRLSDEAIAELTSGKLNNLLLSEIIAHPDFADLIAAFEVFVDRRISDYISAINMGYKINVDSINKQNVKGGHDEYLAALIEANIDPDYYSRVQLTRRFETLAQSIYDAHKKESSPKMDDVYLKMISEGINQATGQTQKYQSDVEETGSVAIGKAELISDQIGADWKNAPENERHAFLSFLSRSKFIQHINKRK